MEIKSRKGSDDLDKKLALLVDLGYSEGQLNWFGRNPDRIDEILRSGGKK